MALCIYRSGTRRRPLLTLVLAAIVALPQTAFANNYGESLGWQFKTSTDRANQTVLLDLIAKHGSGYYAPPIYNTTIARQYNCSIGATATGNSGAQSAIANAPSVTGATSSATGNGNTANAGDGHGDIDNGQQNSGTVSSGVDGGTVTDVHGSASQALNSVQTNHGEQTASGQGSRACTFAALN